MWLKPLMFVLLIALVFSLFSGLFFFLKDQGETRRTFNSLGFRLAIAATLMGLLMYGVYTGQLGSNAPWDKKLYAPAAETKTAPKAQ